MPSTSSLPTEKSLIQRVLDQEADAWSQFVELYGPLIQHWCRRCGLNTQQVEDCTQDVFLVVLQKLNQYRPSETGGGFRSWLWRVTRNKIIDLMRVATRQSPSPGGSSAQVALNNIPMPPEDEQTEPLQLQLLMHRTMQQVRDEFEIRTWQAFERTVIDGLSTEAVSQELQMSPATIRQYRARILRRLRQHLGQG
jgi:RNA polymerase sigma-70 factor, ECF subfamily